MHDKHCIVEEPDEGKLSRPVLKPSGARRLSPLRQHKVSKKVKHVQCARISNCALEQLKMLQLAFREQVIPKDSEGRFKILSSREYGASKAILNVLKETGLEKSSYSRPKRWVKDITAMVVGRLLFAGSKLSLCNQYANTCLWETCSGIKGKVDVDWHCYRSLNKLLERQDRIQKNLAKKHLQSGHLVLYHGFSLHEKQP